MEPDPVQFGRFHQESLRDELCRNSEDSDTRQLQVSHEQSINGFISSLSDSWFHFPSTGSGASTFPIDCTQKMSCQPSSSYTCQFKPRLKCNQKDSDPIISMHSLQILLVHICLSLSPFFIKFDFNTQIWHSFLITFDQYLFIRL